MQEKSTTADELAHLTGGYTFNAWNDYRFHPENGLLPQRWQTLPLLVQGVNYPEHSEDAWQKASVWLMGYRFFYQSGNDHEQMLRSARFMNAWFGAAALAMVLGWSYRLWGPAGAAVAGSLGALCPTMLAHSGVATSDMAMTFFFLAALAASWWQLHDGRWSGVIGVGIVFGLAAVAKHSSLLLAPMVGSLVVLRFFHPSPVRLGTRTFEPRAQRAVALGGILLLQGGIAAGVIWLFFGCRYQALNPSAPAGGFAYPWELMLSFGGIKAAGIEFCRKWHLLPEGYLYGLAFVLKHAEARGAFLDGEYSIYGWARFFPLAFFYKTPLTLLTAVGASAVLVGAKFWRQSRAETGRQLYRVAPLVSLFVVYWLFSLTSHLNIGQRHLLPTYPVLYIFCGVLGWAASRPWRVAARRGWAAAAGIGALLAAHGAVTAGIYPHFLAYFSPVAGGPAQGYKHLVDSSLDWGQDLPGLKQWLTANQKPGEAVYLSYFGTSEPDYYGIKATRLAMLPDFDRVLPWHRCTAGLYVLSATMLQQVYAANRGPWTNALESQYQELRQNEGNFALAQAGPAAHPELFAEITPEAWALAWKRYSQLRLARLCHYLRPRAPDAMIGYSILIYRLNETEVDAALNRDVRTLAAAMESAVAGPPARTSP